MFESKPVVVNNFLTKDIGLFQRLYNELPIEINNKRKIIKKMVP